MEVRFQPGVPWFYPGYWFVQIPWPFVGESLSRPAVAGDPGRQTCNGGTIRAGREGSAPHLRCPAEREGAPDLPLLSQESRSQMLSFSGPFDCHSLHQWVPLKQGTVAGGEDGGEVGTGGGVALGKPVLGHRISDTDPIPALENHSPRGDRSLYQLWSIKMKGCSPYSI